MDILHLDIRLDRQNNRKVVNLRYRLLQTIGQGQFGKVLLAEDLSDSDHEFVAIKTINRVDRAKLITKTYLNHTTKIKREIQIMKECDHPNVVKLFQVIDDLKYDKILLVIEYCKLGEIDWKRYNHFHEKYLKDKSKGITLNKIVRDVTNGLEYLHSYKRIIHRDLKPSNLLIALDRTIKISDFGVSFILENNANDDKELGKTMGTPAFFAPELCQFVNNRLLMLNEADMKKLKIDCRIDIWSLGVVIYCLFFHQLPFEGHNEFSLFKLIVNGELKFPRTRESSHVRIEDLKELELLQDLIRRLLSKDPNQRPTLTEIKHHKFTTFELTKRETDEFYIYNKNIIARQDPQAAEAMEAEENKLANKIRRLFGASKPETNIPYILTSRPVLFDQNLPMHDVNILDLEKVDDLLDSYLDDSSSMGLFSDEEEAASSVVDTSSLLASIRPEKDRPVPSAKLAKSGSTHLAILKFSRDSVPPPLKLLLSTHSTRKTSSSSSSIASSSFPQPPALPFNSGQRTPSTAGSSTVVIGEGSPSSIKSIFSPSRRFFAKIKPTIHSLYSPVNTDSGTASLSDLAPPPVFGRLDRRGSTAELVNSVVSGIGPRKNSTSLTKSGGPKLSSSSLLLNLHGYLTEENLAAFSGKWQRAVAQEVETDRESNLNDESSDEVGDETLTMEPSGRNGDQGKPAIWGTSTMDQYLDRLEG